MVNAQELTINDPGGANPSQTQALLQVADLRVAFESGGILRPALLGVDFHVKPGEIVALVGESGSGKTVSALSIMGLLPSSARVLSGSIELPGQRLLDFPISNFAGVRGTRLAMIFQEPMTSLNPVLTIGEQVAEGLVRHRGMSWREAGDEAVGMLERVGIPDARERSRQYVHQLSGGMRQRVMIASAMIGGPELLIADEPTTALDVTVQAQILDLIRALRDETGMGVLFITHDMGVVAEITERTYVMYAGRIVEEAPTRELLSAPQMPYTRGLLKSLPRGGHGRLLAVPGTFPDLLDPPQGCSFGPRCEHHEAQCDEAIPVLEPTRAGRLVRCIRWRALPAWRTHVLAASSGKGGGAQQAADTVETLLRVAGLKKHYAAGASLFSRGERVVRAVDDVSFTVRRGEVLSLVGESGSGKTTVGRSILRLTQPTAGTVTYDGIDVIAASSRDLIGLRRRMQIVFQDPFASLNPKLTVGGALAEPIRVHRLLSGHRIEERVAELLTMVGLEPEHAGRYPSNFSGGQRQRIAIARALALGPEFIVADEAVSALDVSIRAQVTNLLQDLREQLGLTLLFIAHDLSLVRQISDRVVILYLGKVMEAGPVEAVFSKPRHPYTKALLSAVPVPDPDAARERIILRGEVPSPISPPSGCVFRTRCPVATGDCAKTVPSALTVGPDHLAACLYAG
jgi:peptide/nickel transport system ATP-binding protein